MLNNINSLSELVKGKTVGILGLGVSNLPLAKLLINEDCKLVIRDKKELSGDALEFTKKNNVKTVIGEEYLDNIDEDVVFRSPGIMYTSDAIQKAIKNGVTVTSEMEVFFALCPSTIIGITGSDGKTTTTTLISEMLKAEGKKVFIGGNIGEPLLPRLNQMTKDDYAVVELSSFQLMSMTKSPDIAVITNIAPNHLDKHKDMAEYVEAKKNIFTHGCKKVILNAENDITKSFITENSVTFSLKNPQKNGAYLKDGDIFYNDEFVMKASDIILPGIHNVDNYLAAICAVYGLCGFKTIKKVAQTFGGVEHRIEFVCEKNGVKYYNDSIASSPTRAIAGLNSFNQKVIMIAGGSDKGIAFDNLAKVITDKVKLLIVMGFTKDKIKNAVLKVDGNFPIYTASDLADAVNTAAKNAVSGDIVTLCPACASFDYFKNFADRGNQFKELVKKL